MPASGLNVVNDGQGDGIIGAAVFPYAYGIHGISNPTGASSPKFDYSNYAAVVGESAGDVSAGYTNHGVYGWSQNFYGVLGIGQAGVTGYSRTGIGVIGVSDNNYYYGVLGRSPGTGVYGIGRDRHDVSKGVGVHGEGITGVHGLGTGAVTGKSTIGVHGEGPDIGVLGESQSGAGVQGLSGVVGVYGYGHESGVFGQSEESDGVGVHGDGGRLGIGVRASADTNYALVTDGDVLINGSLYLKPSIFAFKGALVKLRDGSHRALYGVESPECWFEDFGRARVVRGKALVHLDRTFAAVVRTGDYHVFLSPEGLSHGLYVSRRTRDGFEVREQHRGTSTVSFSYRIVARRKDVDAPRFKRVKLPILPKLSRPPRPKPAQISRPVRPSQLKTLLGLTRSRKPSAGKPARPRSQKR